MDIKLFDSELKVMAVLWRDGDVPAKYIGRLLTPPAKLICIRLIRLTSLQVANNLLQLFDLCGT